MRSRIAFVLLLVISACSSTPEQVELSEGRPADVVADVEQPTTTSVSKRPAKAAPSTTTTTIPGTRPVSVGAPWIDPESALIGGVVLEGSGFEGSISPFGGYELFDVQTDCEPFNLFETRVEYSGLMRTQAGPEFNVQHSVFDVPDEARILAATASRVAQECPSMAWLEGGEAINELLSVELPEGWVGFRQNDVGTDQFLQVGVRAHENLLSVVTVISWGHPFGDEDSNLFLSAVVAADEKLRQAEPILREDLPVLVQAGSTTTLPPVAATVPVTTTIPLVALGIFDPLMFDENDLGRPVLAEEMTVEREEFAACEHVDAFTEFFGSLKVIVESDFDDSSPFFAQAVGVAESPSLAAQAISSAEELIACAIYPSADEEVSFHSVTELPDGVLDGAVITMTDTEGPTALVFLQLEGDVNVYLAHRVGTESTTDELISIVAAKLPAYRTWVEGCVRDYPSRSDECAGVEAYL